MQYMVLLHNCFTFFVLFWNRQLEIAEKYVVHFQIKTWKYLPVTLSFVFLERYGDIISLQLP